TDGSVDDHAQVDFPGDVGRLLHQDFGNALALFAGLLGDERVFEHDLGDLATFVAAADEFDAAEVLAAVLETALAAAAGVDLGFEDNRAAQAVERLLSLSRGGDDDPARHHGPGARQQFFRLIFVNLHGWLPWKRAETTLSL